MASNSRPWHTDHTSTPTLKRPRLDPRCECNGVVSQSPGTYKPRESTNACAQKDAIKTCILGGKAVGSRSLMDHQSNHTIPLRHTSGRDSLRGWSPIIHGAVSSEAGTNRVGGSSPGEDIRAIQPPMGSVVKKSPVPQCQTFQSTQLTRELTHSIDWLGMSRSCPLRRNRSIHDDPSRTANAPRTPQLINGDVNAVVCWVGL